MAGEHILIVDDEPAIQSALRGVLEDEGYRVTAVGSGAEAVGVAADEAPDMVFLDIWMPGLDGLETLAQLKRVRPESENQSLREKLDERSQLIGETPVMRVLRDQIAMAAPTNGRVLIHG